MKTALISWDLPTTRESGLPLLGTDIASVEVSMSADLGLNFVVINNLPFSVRTLTVPDLEVGDWIFRLVVIDTVGRRSIDVDTSVNIPDESPPGSVINVSITIS